MTMAAIPCSTCPWRKSSAVGGTDIPGFNIDLMRRLQNTVGREDDFRPIMACHGSPKGAERPCVGYLARHGYSNLAVRVGIMEGRIDMNAVMDECEDLDLWEDFETMLEAYEEAQSGEQFPSSQALH